jgi:hypothetical protein
LITHIILIPFQPISQSFQVWFLKPGFHTQAWRGQTKPKSSKARPNSVRCTFHQSSLNLSIFHRHVNCSRIGKTWKNSAIGTAIDKLPFSF